MIVDLFILNNREKAAQALAPLLQLSPEDIFKQINRDDRRIVSLAKNLETERAEKIRALKHCAAWALKTRMCALGTRKARWPSQLLGHAGTDKAQGEASERSLDKLAARRAGKFSLLPFDAAKRLIALDGDVLADSNNLPRDGLNVSLTIDRARLQEAAEEQLQHIQEDFDPEGRGLHFDGRHGRLDFWPWPRRPATIPNKPEECAGQTPLPAGDRFLRTGLDVQNDLRGEWRWSATAGGATKRSSAKMAARGGWASARCTTHYAYGSADVRRRDRRSSNIGARRKSARVLRSPKCTTPSPPSASASRPASTFPVNRAGWCGRNRSGPTTAATPWRWVTKSVSRQFN